MRVAIIGAGYVGLTTGVCLAYIGHDVVCVDVDEARVSQLESGKSPIYEPYLEDLMALCGGHLSFTTDHTKAVPNADVIFITVGTPAGISGRPDLSYVQAAAQQVGRCFTKPMQVVVNKSTVPIGSGNWVATILREAYHKGNGLKCPDCFAVASNPEFLREGAAVHESLYPDRIVVGADDPRALDVLHELYAPITNQTFTAPDFLPRPKGLTAVPMVESDLVSAEMIKYAANSFLALKVSFINEVSRLAERVGADVSAISQGIGLDSRIGPKFLQAGLGWGGSCFGKDTIALITTAKEYGVDMPIVQAAREVNYQQRHLVIEKLVPELRVLTGRIVGLLGLAFKPDTDDLRDAASIAIINQLLERGVVVKAHDPVAMERFGREYPGLPVRLCEDPIETSHGCDALILVTDWPEYKYLDWNRISGEMRNPLVVDGRNVLDASAMTQAGIKLLRVGR